MPYSSVYSQAFDDLSINVLNIRRTAFLSKDIPRKQCWFEDQVCLKINSSFPFGLQTESWGRIGL